MSASPAVKHEDTSRKNFSIFVDEHGQSCISIKQDSELFKVIKRLIANEYGWSYAETAAIKSSMMFYTKIYNMLKDNKTAYDWKITREIEEILTEVDAVRSELTSLSEERIARGKILFDDIPSYFTEGMEIYCGKKEAYFAGIISKVNIKHTFRGTFYLIEYKYFDNSKGNIGETKGICIIPSFNTTMLLSDLPCRVVTDDIKNELTVRGKVFSDNAVGHHHVYYTGEMVKPLGWRGEIVANATGRIILDINALKNADSDLYGNLFDQYYDDDDEIGSDIALNDNDLWRCSPYLYGFSFVKKMWGRFLVSNISPIKWREDAFDKLVLNSFDKELLKAATEFNKGCFEDMIDGKGGGTIILLDGPPGLGKTLSAETVAEVLHRPLYSVSIGELGTNVDQLEKRLGNILNTSASWDAVLLLDEADIFLESRDSNNIERNAMVGIFLRLLEYHNGVLILTTNRVKSIDTAFMSRISIAMSFTDHDQVNRKKIWNNLLVTAGVSNLNLDVETLSAYELNGRQIKNMIRQGMTLAKSKGEILNESHIIPVIQRTIDFAKRVNDSSETSFSVLKIVKNGVNWLYRYLTIK